MKTIVIKNLSTVWDEDAVNIVEMHTASRRNKEYKSLYNDTKSRYKVNIKITESAVDNKITYTITDLESEPKQSAYEERKEQNS